MADAVKLLGDVVKSTRTMVETINDGRKYLRAKHPQAEPQFAELLEQMQTTVEGLADVTGVISRFRFTVGPEAQSEPRRFNDYVISEDRKIVELKGRIRELKGDCQRIATLRDELNQRADKPDWTSMWGLLGDRGAERASELATALSNFYADDLAMIGAIERMLELAEHALQDVSDALAPHGVADPFYVPTAGAVLAVYAAAFSEPKRDLDRLIGQLTDTRAALTSRSA
ncbi:hypothetical protein [Streptomyces sp. NPDC018693]|uniref:hypothetical protein n=1 Tax=unclassified Streptomyces TaxID=2593676 RepID=UPI0037B71907